MTVALITRDMIQTCMLGNQLCDVNSIFWNTKPLAASAKTVLSCLTQCNSSGFFLKLKKKKKKAPKQWRNHWKMSRGGNSGSGAGNLSFKATQAGKNTNQVIKPQCVPIGSHILLSFSTWFRTRSTSLVSFYKIIFICAFILNLFFFFSEILLNVTQIAHCRENCLPWWMKPF